MLKLKSALIIVAAVFTAHQATAAVFEAECPEEIKTRQAALPPPKGWTAHVETVNSRQIFTGLEIFSGHPKDGGAPVFPDEAPAAASPAAGTTPTATVETTYKLPPGREAFVACQYTNTLVRLIGKIPKTAKTCRVRFSETLGHVQKIACD